MSKGLTLRTSSSRIYALFVSLLPVIMVYKTPGLEIGVSTFLILVFLINAIISIVFNVHKIQYRIIIPVAAFLLYSISKNSGIDALLPFIILIHVIAFSSGVVDYEYLRSTIELIAVVASLCLLLQVIVHAALDIHIPMMNGRIILDSLDVYKNSVETGYSVIDRMYRPSAFFLEPSHFTQYCIVGLGSSLFRSRKSRARSIIITLGILFTTSGLGFVLVFAMWSWWYVSCNGIRSVLLNVKRILVLLILVPLLLLILSRITFFGNIISRFLTPESSGNYNAIAGRLFWWDTYFGSLSWKDLIFGFGADQLPDRYFTGYMTTLYAYGIIGTALFLLSYIVLAIKGRMLSRTLSIMYIGLFFLANLTNIINLIFSFGVILTLLIYEDSDMAQNDSSTSYS